MERNLTRAKRRFGKEADREGDRVDRVDDPGRKGGGGKENFRLEAKEREEAVEGGRWGVGSITRERNLV